MSCAAATALFLFTSGPDRVRPDRVGPDRVRPDQSHCGRSRTSNMSSHFTADHSKQHFLAPVEKLDAPFELIYTVLDPSETRVDSLRLRSVPSSFKPHTALKWRLRAGTGPVSQLTGIMIILIRVSRR